MKKIVLKIIACAILLGVVFIGLNSNHHVNADENNTSTTLTALGGYDPGGGGRP